MKNTPGILMLAGLAASLAPAPTTGPTVANSATAQMTQSRTANEKPAAQTPPTNETGAALAALGTGNGPRFHRSGGLTPKDWGMSAACARMSRKNRMHSAGIGHAKI